MKHVFLTPSGHLQGRWSEAFPEAHVVSNQDELKALPDDVSVLWLDGRNRTAEEVIPELEAALKKTPGVVVLASAPSHQNALALLNRGAKGYCHAYAAPDLLTNVANVVANGGIWLQPRLMKRLIQLVKFATGPNEEGSSTDLNRLTRRELEVAREVANAKSNHEIAETLNITERTVKAHITSIFEKLDVKDRVQLALLIDHATSHDSES